MKNLRTIVLAAGKGTRMYSDIPKILHRVCGKPLIDYVLELAFKVGSLKTCVVLGHQYDAVAAYLKKRYSVSQNISTVLQKKLLGTADAVRSAAKQFQGYKGHILIMCGDTPLLREETLRTLIRRHKKSEAACTFLTAVIQEPKGYGRIIRGPDGNAVAIREEADATDFEKNIAEINVGVYCFRSDHLFKALSGVAMNAVKKEFYLTDIIEILAEQKSKIETIETPEPQEGLGVNSREDLACADAAIRRRILKEFMRQGVTVVDPATTFIHADVRIGRDTVIRPFTYIEEDVRIGARCLIGPFCRLRPGVRLADEVEIGNFTEVSRTQMGKHSLMKHFSFLGDARIGSKVNIGAGTVTANYDGVSKNVTRIADGAFIGSDSILVAPVSIGRKAMTGAGSVVKKGTSVPDGKIAVGVPARVLKQTKKS